MPASVLRATSAGRAWATDLRLGGSLLTIAGVTILMGIITAEALYPNTFTTGGNEISDLGGRRMRGAPSRRYLPTCSSAVRVTPRFVDLVSKTNGCVAASAGVKSGVICLSDCSAASVVPTSKPSSSRANAGKTRGCRSCTSSL